jgi:hypothetical protein
MERHCHPASILDALISNLAMILARFDIGPSNIESSGYPLELYAMYRSGVAQNSILKALKILIFSFLLFGFDTNSTIGLIVLSPTSTRS